jgi:NitT/TauT family transport system substrate-binding protein
MRPVLQIAAYAAAAVWTIQSAAAQNKPPETVTFALAGTATLGYAPFVFAREAGFFAEDNLKLDIVVLQGSGDIIPQLLKGAVQTSMITPDSVVVSKQPGRPNFPIRFAYNTYRQSIWQMAVLEQSPITSIAQLKGKTIGVGALSFANVVQTKALLRRNRIDPADVSFVAVGVGVPAFEALRRGQIDVLNLFATIHAALEGQGTKIRRLPYPPEFANSSSHGMAFTEKTLTERPDLVIRFGRALAKGTIGCQANPEGCLAAYWKAYPEQKPQVVDDKVRAYQLHILETVTDGMTTFREPTQRMGSYSDEDWTAILTSLRQGGELQGPEIPLTALYTNQFVADYNAFDRAAVIAKAKAF